MPAAEVNRALITYAAAGLSGVIQAAADESGELGA